MKALETLFRQLDSYPSSPILFVGSGMSLRYLGTETWEELLRKFSEQIGEPFEKYKSRANRNWPKVGSLLAEDYHDFWFRSPEMKDDREQSKNYMINISSPLKVMISRHLKEISDSKNYKLTSELSMLKSAKIDGIITTNYDTLLEDIFSDFKVYKSQQELIFSSLQEIGEIYKIHGCCTEPNSLIITDEDYHGYTSRNAYLAAKLLTIFLEHPIIFIGYSISDENIRMILNSMITCLNPQQIEKISNRLFFIEYRPGIDDIDLERFNLDIGGNILPVTRILADSYSEIYGVLSALSRRYPASLLRKIKEHIYELVSSNDPTEKISVVDFNSTTDLDKVEVVLGIGIKPKDKGYEVYNPLDLADDVIFDNNTMDAKEVCFKTLPKIYRSNLWIPVCKYVSQISNREDIEKKIRDRSKKALDDWQIGLPQSGKIADINAKYESVQQVVDELDCKNALLIIPLLEANKINTDVLKKFLIHNRNVLIQDNYTKSYWMKLVCLYDRLVYDCSDDTESSIATPEPRSFVVEN